MLKRWTSLNDPLGDLPHQFVVIDPIEKFLQIKINAPAVALGDILLRLCRLYKDETLWNRIRESALAFIQKTHDPAFLKNQLGRYHSVCPSNVCYGEGA